MYPLKVWISRPTQDRYTLYSVILRGYTQAISYEAFNSRILKAGNKAYHSYAGLNAYRDLPNCERDFEIQNILDVEKEMALKFGAVPSLYNLVDVELELADFYKLIGYDRMTQKFSGRTIAQHIKTYWEIAQHSKQGVTVCGK